MKERYDFSRLQLKQPNYLYAILSVSLVLFLLGFFMLSLMQARKLVRIFKEKVNIIVELKRETSQQETAAFISEIEKTWYIKEGSVKFISKEEAIDLLREDFGEEFLKMDINNPLYDIIQFNISASQMDDDNLRLIKKELKENEIIKDVFYQEGLVENISKNIENIGLVAFIVSILFIFVALTLIHNTIKLALYANRFLIKNMELVGATWAFISRPYLLRSLINGVLSALIAIAGLVAIFGLARLKVPDLAQLQDTGAFALLFLMLILTGVLISTLSTYFVVNKYLKMKIEELY